MIQVLPIKGIDSYWALQTYIKLLFGLKMTPMHMGKNFSEFLEELEQLPPPDMKKILKEAILLVTLDRDEVMSLVKFTSDPNGVPYSQENSLKLPPQKIMELIEAVIFEIADMKINFVTPSEKKN